MKFAVGRRLAFAVLIASLSASGQASAVEPRAGGSLSISIESDLPTLDPLGFGSINDRQAGLIVYDSLLDMDASGHLVPSLAEKLDVALDVKSFKLRLRSGVTFHDGTKLDAQAVVAHFRRLMDPRHRCRCLSDLSTVESVEATGELDVVFRMKTPSAHFPAVLADAPGMIASPAAVERLGKDFEGNPVGTGPFRFKEWRRGNQIVFVRNPNYWKGKVHLDEVVLRPLPDEQTRYASLKAGNLDIVLNAAPRDVLDARQHKGIVVIDPGSLATNFVQLNTRVPALSDVRVRLALAHALDRDAYNKVVNKGLYKVANTVFGTGLSPHELVSGYPGYDPARAKQLLADYGKPLKLVLSVNANPQSTLSGQALQQMWKRVGIEVDLRPLEQVQLFQTAVARDYELMLFRWAGRADPDMNVYQFFHSRSPTNRTGYNNPEMDRLLDEARGASDAKVRNDLYRQINNLLAREVPYLLLTYFNNFSLARSGVKGIVPVPDGLIRVDRVWKSE